MKQIPSSLLTLVAGVLIALISVWVGQNHHLLPEQASVQAPLVDNFFNVMVMIATALFIVVQGAILIFAIHFRRRQGDDTDGLPIEGNVQLEIFWTALPAIIVIWLGAYSVEVFTQMGGFSPAGHSPGMSMAHHHSSPAPTGSAIAATLPDSAPEIGGSSTGLKVADASQYGIGATPKTLGKTADVVVNVTGLQYAWLFNYPDRGITAGELHVPIGQDVQLNLSAQDVIHSFWVPQFRLKQDAIPGQPAELRFTATKIGTYPVVCAELCGSYHGSMRTRVIVHATEEYEQWLTENQVAQQGNENSTIAAVERSPLISPPISPPLISPQIQGWGVTPEILAQLNSHPH
jgi:cytochrome c oxidase subunit II